MKHKRLAAAVDRLPDSRLNPAHWPTWAFIALAALDAAVIVSIIVGAL